MSGQMKLVQEEQGDDDQGQQITEDKDISQDPYVDQAATGSLATSSGYYNTQQPMEHRQPLGADGTSVVKIAAVKRPNTQLAMHHDVGMDHMDQAAFDGTKDEPNLHGSVGALERRRQLGGRQPFYNSMTAMDDFNFKNVPDSESRQRLLSTASVGMGISRKRRTQSSLGRSQTYASNRSPR